MHERNLAIFDLDGTITRHDTLLPFIAGFLWRHPWRLWRWLPCLLPLLRYVAGARDRGALKSRIIQLTLGGVASAPLTAWAVRFARRLVRSSLYAEALECITAHQRNHDHLVLLSASPNLYVPGLQAILRVRKSGSFPRLCLHAALPSRWIAMPVRHVEGSYREPRP